MELHVHDVLLVVRFRRHILLSHMPELAHGGTHEREEGAMEHLLGPRSHRAARVSCLCRGVYRQGPRVWLDDVPRSAIAGEGDTPCVCAAYGASKSFSHALSHAGHASETSFGSDTQ
jgi:hypothetical protein